MTNLEAMDGRRGRQQLNPFLNDQSSCFLQFSYLQITQWSISQVATKTTGCVRLNSFEVRATSEPISFEVAHYRSSMMQRVVAC